MMKLLLALHKIAAARGEGLHPKLLRLLVNRTPTVSGGRGNRRVTELETDHASPDFEAPHENVLPLRDRSRKQA